MRGRAKLYRMMYRACPGDPWQRGAYIYRDHRDRFAATLRADGCEVMTWDVRRIPELDPEPAPAA